MADQHRIGKPLALEQVNKSIKPKQVLVWDESTKLVKRVAVDAIPTKNSNNFVTSGDIYNAINNIDIPESTGGGGTFDTAANYTVTGLWTFNHASGIVVGTGSVTDTKISQWDTAYTHSQSAHAPSNADNTAANETSHSDVLVDSDFVTQGLMVASGAGSYTTTPNNSTNWNTAHAWGDHSVQGYVNDSDFSTNGILKRTSVGTYSVEAIPLGVDVGGTGRTSLDSNRVLIGNGTGAVTLEAKNDAFNRAFTTSGSKNGTAITVARGDHYHETLGFSGTFFTVTGYDGSTGVSQSLKATSNNTASYLVQRDGSGNFTAGTITASLTGRASEATKVATTASASSSTFPIAFFDGALGSVRGLIGNASMYVRPSTGDLYVNDVYF